MRHMRAVGYVRVSRVGGREGDSFISPGVQRERVEAWAKAGGHEIIAWHEDLDEPGSRLDRPHLEQALMRIEAREADAIAVAKLDRFTRSTAHLGPLLDRLKQAEGILISVGEGIDTSTAAGKLVADIMGAISEWELTRISENWQAARQNAARRGVHIAGRVPTGYVKGEDGVLGVDERLAPLVTELFRKRIAGESWAVLADWFTDQGVVTPWGNETWSRNSIRSVVANRAYLGETSAGDVVNRDAHPPLVSIAEWEAANQAQGTAPARNGRASGLLTGLVRCAGCRYAMTVAQHRSRHGKDRLMYRCKSSRKQLAGRCPEPASVTTTVIDDFVMEAFWAEAGRLQASQHTADPGRELEAAEAELRAAENQLAAAMSDDLAEALGGRDDPYFLQEVERRRGTVALASKRLGAVRRRLAPNDFPDVNLRDLWPDLSLYDHRRLLAATFDAVFVRRAGGPRASAVPITERAHICPRGSDLELPVRGQRWVVKSFSFPDRPAAAEVLGAD